MENKIQEEINEEIFANQNTLENVAVVKGTDDNNIYTNYKFPVRIPKQYTGDFMVEIRASDLRKVRKCCEKAKNNKFTVNELVLSITGITIGVVISAIVGKIPFNENSFASIFSYNICPLFSVGLIVFYFKSRKENMQNINDLVEKIEEYIIDPDNDTDNGRSEE